MVKKLGIQGFNENKYWWIVVNIDNASNHRVNWRCIIAKRSRLKNEPKYIPVLAYSKQVIEKQDIYSADLRDIIEATLEEIERDRKLCQI